LPPLPPSPSPPPLPERQKNKNALKACTVLGFEFPGHRCRLRCRF
jgi:hypothetical protein